MADLLAAVNNASTPRELQTIIRSINSLAGRIKNAGMDDQSILASLNHASEIAASEITVKDKRVRDDIQAMINNDKDRGLEQIKKLAGFEDYDPEKEKKWRKFIDKTYTEYDKVDKEFGKQSKGLLDTAEDIFKKIEDGKEITDEELDKFEDKAKKMSSNFRTASDAYTLADKELQKNKKRLASVQKRLEEPNVSKGERSMLEDMLKTLTKKINKDQKQFDKVKKNLEPIEKIKDRVEKELQNTPKENKERVYELGRIQQALDKNLSHSKFEALQQNFEKENSLKQGLKQNKDKEKKRGKLGKLSKFSLKKKDKKTVNQAENKDKNKGNKLETKKMESMGTLSPPKTPNVKKGKDNKVRTTFL